MKRVFGIGLFLFLCSIQWGCRGAAIRKQAQAAQQSCAIAANQRKLELAENYCKLALRYNPKFAEAFNGLALVAIQRGKYKKAERFLKKALSINSNFADARSNLGHIYYLRKDYKRAMYLFKTALDIKPSLLNAGYNIARTLIILRRFKDARNQIIQSIFFPKNRRFPPFHYLLGYIEFERKNYKGSIKHWIDCVKLDPNYTSAHLSLCKALYQISQFGHACFHCQQVLRVQPKHVDGQRSLKAVNVKLRQQGKQCNRRLRSL